ncbi:MerR family transcriptional regulator [Kocuria tytonis]|uniref:DNA-binding protein n=1 Tax=Kocuria tytonis TaxID=2054280 RepID=A0A495A8Z8_9MICC|nr:hypothetical protein [Kocuria tytonis]RKQ36243.1 hypothetical protein C1C97_000710 [Kocuria tytonis]
MDTITMSELYTQAQTAGTTAATALKERITMDKDLSVKIVADMTSQSPAVIGRLVRAGYFPGAYKAGMGEGNAKWVIPYSAVQAYRERMQAKTGLSVSGK